MLRGCYDRSLELALELDVAGTNDLIVRYFIGQGNYNPVEINLVLYEFDQSLPGE